MKISKRILIFIVILGALFRFMGINWDQGQHLHPDERFLTMVATAIKWPGSVSEYFDPSTSPLNPANANFGFFVYGTFPLFLVKALADIMHLGHYGNLTAVGRMISGAFDLFTIVIVYKIAALMVLPYSDKKIATTPLFPLLAAFFYAIAVLPIQLSHFFAVDTFLVFFTTACFYLLAKSFHSAKKLYAALLLGISFGLAVGSKISAILLLPIIMSGITVIYMLQKHTIIASRILGILSYMILFTCASYLSFRFTNPYVFVDQNIFNINVSQAFIDNVKSVQNLAKPDAHFSPRCSMGKYHSYRFSAAKPCVLWFWSASFAYCNYRIFFYALISITKSNETEKIGPYILDV